MERHLILMVKEPRMGVVKTRLARDIGAVAATHFYRTVTANLIRRLMRDPRWRLLLAIAPDCATTRPFWPSHLPRIAQGTGDLGARMERLLYARRAGSVVLIGSDIPGITPRYIAAAFDELRRNDVVFGPADDGGFWLIGVNRSKRLRGLFHGVRWSSPATLSDTLANLEKVSVGFVEKLTDVDDAASHRRAARLAARVTPIVG